MSRNNVDYDREFAVANVERHVVDDDLAPERLADVPKRKISHGYPLMAPAISPDTILR